MKAYLSIEEELEASLNREIKLEQKNERLMKALREIVEMQKNDIVIFNAVNVATKALKEGK